MKNKVIMFVGVVLLSMGAYFIINQIRQEEKDLTNQSEIAEKIKSEPKKLRIQAGWLLNGEFANICSAIVNGYYKDENLEVELVPGGPAGASFIIATNTIAQDTSLGIGVDGDLIPLLRGITKENENERLKVKAFAGFWNENPYGFIVREDSGIQSLKDLAKKRKPNGEKYKIGITADSVAQYAIAQYAEVPAEDLNLVTVGFDATPFLTNQVDALASYWTTQAYEVEKAGIKYKFLSMSEIPGYSQPSQIALATDQMIKNEPETLAKWLRATIKGTQFVIQNPAEAAKQITDSRCGGKNFDPQQEEWLIKKSIPLFDENKVGWLDETQIMNYAKSYYDLKQIPRIPAKEEIIDYSILNAVYQK